MKTLIIAIFSTFLSTALFAQMPVATVQSNQNMDTSVLKLEYAGLPNRSTWVPDNVFATLKNKFGDALYDVATVKQTRTTDAYAARVMQGGVYVTQWVNADGSQANMHP